MWAGHGRPEDGGDASGRGGTHAGRLWRATERQTARSGAPTRVRRPRPALDTRRAAGRASGIHPTTVRGPFGSGVRCSADVMLDRCDARHAVQCWTTPHDRPGTAARRSQTSTIRRDGDVSSTATIRATRPWRGAARDGDLGRDTPELSHDLAGRSREIARRRRRRRVRGPGSEVSNIGRGGCPVTRGCAANVGPLLARSGMRTSHLVPAIHVQCQTDSGRSGSVQRWMASCTPAAGDRTVPPSRRSRVGRRPSRGPRRPERHLGMAGQRREAARERRVDAHRG